MTNLYKIFLCFTVLLLTEAHYCLAQTNVSPKSENPEYKQYRYLADAYFNEGAVRHPSHSLTQQHFGFKYGNRMDL